jgi:hypothetical protein
MEMLLEFFSIIIITINIVYHHDFPTTWSKIRVFMVHHHNFPSEPPILNY